MRIGIDARFLGSIGKGLGRYSSELVRHLEEVDQENEYIIFISPESQREYQPHNPRFHIVTTDIGWYGWKEQIIFPWMLYRYNLDIMHFLHFNVPLLYFRPFVVTIHDLILLQFPTKRASRLNYVKYFLKNLAYRLVIYRAVHQARQVITISQWTKWSLIDVFSMAPHQIVVTYNGINREYFSQQPSGQLSFADHGIHSGQYFLYVGNAYPHKNIERLLQAFQYFVEHEEQYQDIQLVLVGKIDYFFQRIQQYAVDLNLQDRVIFTGFISDAALRDMYEQCLGYVFPSLYEGFGLPPLEALNMKKPVLLSNATCLPEIFGAAADYVNAYDPYDIYQGLLRIIQDPQYLSRQLQHTEIFNAYSWYTVAKITQMVYNTHSVNGENEEEEY